MGLCCWSRYHWNTKLTFQKSSQRWRVTDWPSNGDPVFRTVLVPFNEAQRETNPILDCCMKESINVLDSAIIKEVASGFLLNAAFDDRSSMSNDSTIVVVSASSNRHVERPTGTRNRHVERCHMQFKNSTFKKKIWPCHVAPGDAQMFSVTSAWEGACEMSVTQTHTRTRTCNHSSFADYALDRQKELDVVRIYLFNFTADWIKFWQVTWKLLTTTLAIGKANRILLKALVVGNVPGFVQMRGRSDTPGPDYCPRIESASSGNSSEILVPSSTGTIVKVKALHLQVGFCFILSQVLRLSVSSGDSTVTCTRSCYSVSQANLRWTCAARGSVREAQSYATSAVIHWNFKAVCCHTVDKLIQCVRTARLLLKQKSRKHSNVS